MNVNEAAEGAAKKVDKAAKGANKAADAIKDEIKDVADEAQAAAFDVGALVNEHPVGTLLAALGIGYAVGGGIFTSLTRRLLGAGLRLGVQFAVLPALERELAGLAGDLGKSLNDTARGEDVPDGPQRRGGES